MSASPEIHQIHTYIFVYACHICTQSRQIIVGEAINDLWMDMHSERERSPRNYRAHSNICLYICSSRIIKKNIPPCAYMKHGTAISKLNMHLLNRGTKIHRDINEIWCCWWRWGEEEEVEEEWRLKRWDIILYIQQMIMHDAYLKPNVFVHFRPGLKYLHKLYTKKTLITVVNYPKTHNSQSYLC